jgi:sulfite dehydrogenase (cytochrome) subunit B
MNKLHRFAAPLVAVLGVVACAAPMAADMSGTVKIELPPETARFKPGPGMDTAAKSCMTCHSVDYVYMQPPLTKDQWHGEVMKMKKVYGATFAESDVDTIVNYLMSQNGKK